MQFVEAVEQGDLVVLHTHQVWAEDSEYVTVDFFRFDDANRILEHWDAVQRIPGSTAN